MKRFVFAAVAACLTSCANTPPGPISTPISLTPEEVQMCADQGGCVVVTREMLVDQMRKAIEHGKAMERSSCGKET